MINKKYCDITALRTFFNDYESQFTGAFITMRKMNYGLNTGKMVSGNIEPLNAVVSQTQYFLKKTNQKIPSWWYIQHIILSYVRESILTGKTATSENNSALLNSIKVIKTDQGSKAFTDKDIMKVLQVISNYKSDPVISLVYSVAWLSPVDNSSNVINNTVPVIEDIISPVIPEKPVMPENNIDADIMIPEVPKDNVVIKAGINPLLIGAVVLGILMILKKK